jgi:hypothetical protein
MEQLLRAGDRGAENQEDDRESVARLDAHGESWVRERGGVGLYMFSRRPSGFRNPAKNMRTGTKPSELPAFSAASFGKIPSRSERRD